jgi:MFS family permease
MVKKSETTGRVAKFAGIEVPPGLNKNNFFFLFFNTFLAGLLMSVFGILQPAFLKDVININQDFAGSINGLLMNLNEVATLALVALVGALSDTVGRKMLALLGFVVLALFFYLLGQANTIASFLQVPTGIASQIAAFLSFVPSRSAEFTQCAPGLLITYVLRLFLGVGLILCYPQFITMVADYTHEKDRGKGMAMNGVMMAISSLLIFALFVPIMARIGVPAFIYIIIAIALVGALSTGLFLKDRLPEVKQEKVGLLKIIPVVRKSLALKTKKPGAQDILLVLLNNQGRYHYSCYVYHNVGSEIRKRAWAVHRGGNL